MARPGGFEPPTAWFVARYSIQLSYGRAVITSCIIQMPALRRKRSFVLGRHKPKLEQVRMARPGGFEPPTAWFVARYSIQLSYGRTTYLLNGGEGGIRTLDAAINRILLSRGAPSASRPPHRTNHGALGRIRTSDRLVRSQVLYPAELRAHNNSGLFTDAINKHK